MKSITKLGVLVVSLFLALSAVSCSDDDDDASGNGKGNNAISVTLDGKSVKFSNVYWYRYEGEVYVEFYSYDPTNIKSMPNSINFLSISFDAADESNELPSVTVPSGEYHIYVAKNVTMNSDGWQGETIWRDTSNSPLIIKKEGNTYHISVEKATVGDDVTDTNISISYNGKVPLLPSKYRPE